MWLVDQYIVLKHSLEFLPIGCDMVVGNNDEIVIRLGTPKKGHNRKRQVRTCFLVHHAMAEPKLMKEMVARPWHSGEIVSHPRYIVLHSSSKTNFPSDLLALVELAMVFDTTWP